MSEVTYYKEEELNKLHKSKYGLQDEFVPEEYHSVYFDVNGDDCSVKAYCINSIPSFCRVRKKWSLCEESPFKYVGFQNINNAYQQFNLIHLKVAWGACAFFFYVKWIDDRGHSRYNWNKELCGLEKCRQYYFDTCYNIYKAQNRNVYGYYEENNIIDEFKAEFATWHIESEKELIERTVNTKDIFEEYDKTLGIRQEAEEYLEWVRSTYLPSQAETKETIESKEYLLRLFNENKAIYDMVVIECKNKVGADIPKEIIGAIRAISNDKIADYLFNKECKYKHLHDICKELGFSVAGYQAFKDAFVRADGNNLKLQNKIKEITQKYKKILLQKL